MGRSSMGLALAAGMVAAVAGQAPAAGEEGGGSIPWKASWPAAVQAARRSGKPLFIDAGSETWGICQRVVSVTLRDPQASRLIRRHFIAVSVDVANAPEPLPALFSRTGGKTMPFLLYLTDRGQYVGGTSGLRTAEDVRTDLEKVLTAKGLAMPKSREAPLAKQVNALGEALDGHQYRKASTIFSGITRARGYSPAKDAAYDRMDAAQASGTKKLETAVGLAKEDRYAEARAALAGVPRELAGLPVAEEGKGHLAALKLLESAHQLTQDKKRGWQKAAFQRLSQVIRQHGDTPYANLATRRQAELVKRE